MPIVLLIVLLAIAAYIGLAYNRLVTLRTRIKASIQEIGNQLKRQADLIPGLVESAKGYLKHERAIFKDLTEARKAILEATSQKDPQKMVEVEGKMRRILGNLRVLVESNPQLKGAETVTKLMDELRDTADKIMYARRTLIDLTADYNIKLETFPSNLVARLFNFKTEKGLTTPTEGEFLEVSEKETKTPGVGF